MPHPPQLFGSLTGFTHVALQQRRAVPHAASHPAPPELPLPELLPLELPLLDPLEPPPLEPLPLEPLPLPELLPEPSAAASAEASSPGGGMKAIPPQREAARAKPTNPIGKKAIRRTIRSLRETSYPSWPESYRPICVSNRRRWTARSNDDVGHRRLCQRVITGSVPVRRAR
jgi:hypothetical protein